jgi:capsular exopolysaccharide synthesis family protein
LAIAREQIDEAVREPSDVEALLHLPVLGVIPKVKVDEPILELDDPKSPLLEAYISARTSLGFSTDHGTPKSLAVSSTRATEGKSTTAYALALTLARGQNRVLLIDADLRSPSVHGLLNIGNESGLSNFLSGSDDLESLILPTRFPHLSVMVAGPAPPNAAELLSGDRLALLLERLKAQFDHIVLDAPPVLGLADAPLIGSQVEGLIFAVEAHGTGSGLIKIAIKRLQGARTKILGVILTKFESKRASYGYGYDYGYGYGAADSASSETGAQVDRSS